jgi:hypothetical protein
MTATKEPESRNKLARKSKDITMTPARESKSTTSNATKGDQEQSAPKKTRRKRKKGLLKIFGDGARVAPPSIEGTPMDATKIRRRSATGTIGTKNKCDFSKGKESSAVRNRNQMTRNPKRKLLILIRWKSHYSNPKAHAQKPRKDHPKRTRRQKHQSLEEKRRRFAKTVGKEVVKEKDIEYKMCVVGFAIRVDKTKDTKGGFDKKLNKGLRFMQTYIDQHASFHPINPDSALKPIKEKGDFPRFQVTSQSYFCMPNPRAFDNINADAGQTIKGSAVMGFSDDPKHCLEEAAGDLRTM